MKKVILFLSVIGIASSLMAVDIFTRTTGKKPSNQKEKPAEKEKVETVLDVPVPEKTICAVTGSAIKVNESTPSSDYNGVRYYFISNSEKAQFETNQFKYAKDIETCQVCGTQEKKTRGKSAFVEASSSGKTYRFCTLIHSKEFEKDPAKYIRGSGSYWTKQTGKKKSTSKTGEKQGDKKGADEDIEILEEETIPETPAVKAPEVKTPEVKAPEKKEEPKKEEKAIVEEPKKPLPEVKKDPVKVPEKVEQKQPEAPVKNPAPAKKEETQEIEEIIMEE